MLRRSTGMAMSMSCRAAWARVTASTSIGEPESVAIARCSRESATRCAAASGASSTSRRLSVSQARWSPASGWVAANHAAPGSTTRRKARASSIAAPLRTNVPVTPRDDAGISAAYVTVVPPPRPRLVVTRPESRSAAMASRNVLRLTPRRSARSRSGGSCSPSASTPRRIARASCSTVFSKALPDAGRSTASGNAVSARSRPPPTASMSAEDLRGRLRVVPLRDVTHEVDPAAREPRSPSRRRGRPAPRSARS